MEFIFMLTHNDSTVANAREVLDSIVDTGLTHVGFKDVGATAAKQRELADAAHAAGMTVYLEIVSVDKQDELNSVDAAIAAGVDWIVGGKFAEEATARLAGTGIKFAPFPGHIIGHPSVLAGELDEIADHAARLVAMPGVDGVDLLAYRHKTVDPLELTRAVAQAVAPKPVVAAGSVVSKEQIDGLAKAGAWGFTIGGAIFDGLLPGDHDVASQVRMALKLAADATAANR